MENVNQVKSSLVDQDGPRLTKSSMILEEFVGKNRMTAHLLEEFEHKLRSLGVNIEEPALTKSSAKEENDMHESFLTAITDQLVVAENNFQHFDRLMRAFHEFI